MAFITRTDAGRQLATVLRSHVDHNTIVIGVTRGGVAVAAEVARELVVPLEACVVRRLQASDGRWFGCVAERDGLFIDEARVEQMRMPREELARIVAREAETVARLSALYRDSPALLVSGRDLIVVDDGLSASATVFAVAQSLRKRGARSIALAVPIADRRVLDEVAPAFDRTVALEIANPLVSIGAHYSEFLSVSEAEVIELIADARRGGSVMHRAVSRRAY